MSNSKLIVLSIALIAFAGVLIAIAVRYLERRRHWGERAERLLSHLVSDLARDASLRGLAFVPHLSIDADGFTEVAVSGVVSSESDRDRVLRAVRGRVAGLLPGAVVEDALRVERPTERAAS